MMVMIYGLFALTYNHVQIAPLLVREENNNKIIIR